MLPPLRSADQGTSVCIALTGSWTGDPAIRVRYGIGIDAGTYDDGAAVFWFWEMELRHSPACGNTGKLPMLGHPAPLSWFTTKPFSGAKNVGVNCTMPNG
nr:hypothetical protein [Pseudoflavitalea rhizosphaerae]